ncbi:hypothetical protein DITRI_Ditri16bG0077400 [Diplodiscus trichospermus]
MDDDIPKLWKKLSLIEDKREDVVIEKDWVLEILYAGKNYLLRKLKIRRNVNLKAMRNALNKIWKLSRRLVIREVRDQLFIFQIEKPKEKIRVLLKQPRSFNKSLQGFKGLDDLVVLNSVNMD